MLLEKDPITVPFEIKAIMREPAEEESPALYELRIMHVCKERKATFECQKSWNRCPWCSSRMPQKIRRVFTQADAVAGKEDR